MMNCEFKLKRKLPISRIIWLIILALAVGFFTKVWLWEHSYYSEKEGSERVAAINNSTDSAEPEVDETVPTEEEVAEYNVAPDRPRYLTIPSIGVKKSRVLPMGLTNTGALDTPRNIFDVGWYVNSGKPGTGGTMVIDGHNGGPNIIGVFKYLPDIPIGSRIVVERGDGVVFEYETVENNTVPLSEADAYMATALTSPDPDKESITLITCTGQWAPAQGTYLSRQFLRAVLVDSTMEEPELEETE